MIKVVVIGDSSVGKTSLIQMFEHSKFTSQFKPTIGADFSNKIVELPDGRNCTLQIWDTAGQERFQSLGTAFYRGADCCLLVYDVTNLSSFEHIQSWQQNFLRKSNPENPETFPFMMIGNKVDLEEGRAVPHEDALEYSKTHEIIFFETSAKSNLNVGKAF